MLGFFDFAVAGLAVLMTVLVALWWTNRQQDQGLITADAGADPVSLLFEDGILHHASPRATGLLSMSAGAHFWDDLRNTLLARFPDFPQHPSGDGDDGHLSLRAIDTLGPQEALIHWRGNLCWVTLNDAIKQNGQQMKSDTTELRTLRRINNAAPCPAWEEDAQGTVLWHNTAYADLARQVRGNDTDPNKTMFSKGTPDRPNRIYVSTKDEGTRDWYEQTAIQSDGKTVFHALGISAVVAAEETQRNFVQTLAKTFAHLSTGLAIFDRNKQLVLFNPALIDLTGLPAHFLSARPDMLSFFDRLRENRKMPEPKNYSNWRDEIAGMIAAASDGRYQETWSLETGQTYSVQGRPHPDGTTAFLIEDISAEMTLTRNFRAELEQAQIILDAVEDAVAIFSPAGVMTFSNAAYQTLWQINPDTTFVDMTLQDCAALWKGRAQSGADVLAIGRFLSELGLQYPQGMTLHLKDKSAFKCQMMPIPSGATLIRFHPIREPVRQLEKHTASAV